MRVYRFADLVTRGIISNRMQPRRWLKYGFPPPIQLGPNTIAWPADEVDAWVADRPRRYTVSSSEGSAPEAHR